MLTIAGTAVAYYATGNLTSSATSKSRMSAYDLAEAGINDAKSVLYNQLNPDGSVKAGGTSPTTPTLLSQTTIQYPDVHGSVTYAGTLDTSTYVWTITSTGKVKNDQGYQSRTLTKTVTVRGLNVGADGSSWSRFYQDDPSTCLTIDQETIVTNFATRGPLCLVNGGAITGANTTVDVGTTVTISGADASAGANSPSAASSSGAPAWSNTSNVYTSNSSYATDVISSNGTGGSLNASGYGFSIPATAIVRGITVSVIRKSNISGHTQDSSVYLLKAGAQAGSDHHLGGTWGTSNTTKTYGSASDLWGTSWTAADVDSAGFGVKFTAKTDSTGTTASVDYVSVTVTYSNDTNGIGTPGTPVTQANVGGTCTYNAQSAHTPCTSTDHVYATTITSTPAGSNPALVMPQVDFDYWWANAKPGPKHFCTNSNPGLSSNFFDNDAASTSAPNGSLMVNGEMAPANSDYTCQVVENGVLQGELSWDHTTHVMTVERHDLHRRQLPLGHRRGGRPLLRPRQHHVLEGRRDRRRRLRGRQRDDAGDQLPHRHVELGHVPEHDRADVADGQRVRPGRLGLRRGAAQLLRRPPPRGLPGDPLLDGRLPDPPAVPGQRARDLQHDLDPPRGRRRPDVLHLPVHRQSHRRAEVRGRLDGDQLRARRGRPDRRVGGCHSIEGLCLTPVLSDERHWCKLCGDTFRC